MRESSRFINKVLMFLVLGVISCKSGFSFVTNNGLSLTIKSTLTITIIGSFVNQTKDGVPGSIDNSGTIKITGNWTNNANNEVFSTNAGTVELNATQACQNISGSFNTGFYNLILNNSCPDGPYKYVSNVNFTVKNNLSLISGIMELNGYSITTGINALNIGSLNRTAGWFKGGVLKRWVGVSLIAERDSKGYFPLGDSINYRPAWLSTPSNLITNGGTISVSHASVNEVIPTYIPDDILIVKKHKSYWNILTENLSGGKFNLYLQANGYSGIENINELRICKDTSVCGLPGTNSGNVNEPEAIRQAINLEQLSGAFFIGSTNGGPLPVKWLDFQAINHDNFVQLIWNTASENNNDYFTVERTTDGKIIEQIASLPGAGNSNNTLNYNYYDCFPIMGASYYRIKQTDYDGKMDTTAWKMVDHKSLITEFSFNVFPNPLIESNTIKIDFKGEKDQDALVLINDLLGNLYFSRNYVFKQGENNIYLDTDKKLQTGIYNLTISGNHVLCRKRIIVN